MLPEAFDDSHSDAVNDAMLDAEPRLIREWARDIEQWLDEVEASVARAMQENNRTAGFLETPVEATDGVERAMPRARQTPEEDWIGQIIRDADVLDQVEQGLMAIYTRHALNVAEDIVGILNAEFGVAFDMPDSTARQVIAEFGRRLGLLDFTEQARREMFAELLRGRQAGEAGETLARRIRNKVSAGRYKNAATRALVIARTETAHAQRYSSLKLYREHPSFVGVKLYDGQLPSSDDECIARNGTIVSFDEADELMSIEHPAGTLTFAPVTALPQVAA